mmetsp:Transcript_121319/g.387744  ORF Transcript_121319/g.387744 Transcript_121319/m.387744 type:complete len:243 (+) Transcript_121319:322-1050(+)
MLLDEPQAVLHAILGGLGVLLDDVAPTQQHPRSKVLLVALQEADQQLAGLGGLLEVDEVPAQASDGLLVRQLSARPHEVVIVLVALRFCGLDGRFDGRDCRERRRLGLVGAALDLPMRHHRSEELQTRGVHGEALSEGCLALVLGVGLVAEFRHVQLRDGGLHARELLPQRRQPALNRGLRRCGLRRRWRSCAARARRGTGAPLGPGGLRCSFQRLKLSLKNRGAAHEVPQRLGASRQLRQV